MKLNEGINDKWIFKAVFLAGAPGSGKNFFLNKTLYSFKNLDPDAIRMLIYKKRRMPADYYKQTKKERKIANKEVHPETNRKTSKKEELVIEGRLPLIMNRTGKDFEKTASIKRRLESLGYETKMVYIDTSPVKSIERNRNRERRLDDKFVKDTYKKVKANKDKFKSLFGSDFHVINNTEDGGNKEEYEKIWKVIARWMDKPVTNQAANRWKVEQRAKATKKDPKK